MESQKLKILVVEDDLLANKMLSKILNMLNFEVFSAFDGAEGFSKYSEIKPDIIITDLNMPVMCGCELVKKIRKIDTTTPIIICTGEPVKDIYDMVIIEKPICLDTLKSKIQQILSLDNDSINNIPFAFCGENKKVI